MVNVGAHPAATLVAVVWPYDSPYLRKIVINHPSCILPIAPVRLANAPEPFRAIWGNPMNWTFMEYPITPPPVTPIEWPEDLNVFE